MIGRWGCELKRPKEKPQQGGGLETGSLISRIHIRPSIGTEDLIPEEVNYTKITIRVTVMNKVQFLLASEPRKPLQPRSLNMIFLVEKDVSVKRRRACDYHHNKKI